MLPLTTLGRVQVLTPSWFAGRVLAPTVLALQSPHVDLQLHGWRTTTGMVLRGPATASIEYTPALARCRGMRARGVCMTEHEHDRTRAIASANASNVCVPAVLAALSPSAPRESVLITPGL